MRKRLLFASEKGLTLGQPQAALRSVDTTEVRVRWPFPAALIGLLIVVMGWHNWPDIQASWQAAQDDRALHADIKRLAPAVAALNGMAWPQGARACAGKPVNVVGMACLNDESSVLSDAAEVSTALDGIGARVTDRKCVRLRNGWITCRLAGELRGQKLDLGLGPQVGEGQPDNGVRITGGVGDHTLSVPLPHGAGLPFPS